MPCDHHTRCESSFVFWEPEAMDPTLSIHLLFLLNTLVKAQQNCSKEMVLIRPHTHVKYFDLPTSDEPVVTWMDIQKGIYPNTSYIDTALGVGEPITIFIYLKDSSNLYDIKVTDCWAYDDENYDIAANKLHLSGKSSHSTKRRTNKLIEKWHKKENLKGSILKTFLYTDLKSFKFPDKDQIYMKCDIELCFKSCV